MKLTVRSGTITGFSYKMEADEQLRSGDFPSY